MRYGFCFFGSSISDELREKMDIRNIFIRPSNHCYEVGCRNSLGNETIIAEVDNPLSAFDLLNEKGYLVFPIIGELNVTE